MSDATFDELQAIQQKQGPAATIEHLISVLRRDKRFHALFDSLLMKRRLELGLPLVRPTSLKEIPEGIRDEFERFYIDTARDVGRLLLEEGLITQAWNYFRAINEPQPVAAAIEALPDEGPVDDELVELAMFQGLSPVKGLKLFLSSHGTCSTITALDQQFLQMPADVRAGCARALVSKLYNDLRGNVEHDVLRRQPLTPPGQSLRELISGREALFADDSYHIDVSHLNAVVRFGRSLNSTDPELDLALQLAQYGARLAPQYQYAGNPPFDDFYPAHIQFFKALLGQDTEQALDFFRKKLGEDPAETDNQLTAYVLVDLLQRLGWTDEALELACRYLSESGEEFGLSLPELCAKSGRFDLLGKMSREHGDLVTYAASLIGAAK